MNKEQGFILKPGTYNQKEWYEVFMNLLKEYRQKCNIIKELEKYINENYVLDEPIKFKNDLLDKLKQLKGE